MSERDRIIDAIIAKVEQDFEKDMLESGEGYGDEFYLGMSIGIAVTVDKLEEARDGK